MSKAIDIGVNNLAYKIKNIYAGDANNKTQLVKSGLIGVNGVAQLFYGAGGVEPATSDMLENNLILCKSYFDQSHSYIDPNTNLPGQNTTEIWISTDHGESFKKYVTVCNGVVPGEGNTLGVRYDATTDKLFLKSANARYIMEVLPDQDEICVKYWRVPKPSGTSTSVVDKDPTVYLLGVEGGIMWYTYILTETSGSNSFKRPHLIVYDYVNDVILNHSTMPSTSYDTNSSNVGIYLVIPPTDIFDVDRSYSAPSYDVVIPYLKMRKTNSSSTFNEIYGYLYEYILTNKAFTNVPTASSRVCNENFIQGSSNPDIPNDMLGNETDYDTTTSIGFNADRYSNEGFNKFSVYVNSGQYHGVYPWHHVYYDRTYTFSSPPRASGATYSKLRGQPYLIYNNKIYMPEVSEHSIKWYQISRSANPVELGTTPITDNLGDIFLSFTSDNRYFYFIARNMNNYWKGQEPGWFIDNKVNYDQTTGNVTITFKVTEAQTAPQQKLYRIDPENLTAAPRLLYTGNDEMLSVNYGNFKGTYRQNWYSLS